MQSQEEHSIPLHQLTNKLSEEMINNFKDYDRQQLIQQLLGLEKKNKKLKARIAYFEPHKQRNLKQPNPQKTKKLFNEYQSRKFALKICYLGFTYDGMALQFDTDSTIEAYLFKAMSSLNLIPGLTPGDCYTRAGRTDKGVSAMGNVVSLQMRTSIKKCHERQSQEQKNTINYCTMLNSLLPEDIRVIGCEQVPSQFNSRYHCISRSYKYFFTKNHLNIQAMQEAIKDFVGTHNFINFCKMNLSNTVSFQRTIFKAEIKKVEQQLINNDQRNQIYFFHFVGNSFLWHQIRFMTTILFLIGQKHQEITIVKDLLDINKFPRKPSYPIAPQFPLVLEDCIYNEVTFLTNINVIKGFYNDFNKIAMQKLVEMTLIVNCMNIAKKQLLDSLSISSQLFQQTVQREGSKIIKGTRKALGIQKPSARGFQEAANSLKGKKLQLYKKKMQKKAQYEQKMKDQKEKGQEEKE